MHIPSACLMTLGDKLTLYIPDGKINPFSKLSKPVDVILMSEKDYNMNLKYIAEVIDEKTKILFY